MTNVIETNPHAASAPAILGGKPKFEKQVPITEPTLPSIPRLKKRFEQILKSRMITNAQTVREFETAVAEHLGVKHAVAVNSCTSGLMLIMKAMALEGEVILPSFTFHATAHAVVWAGLTPVFVDCDSRTFNLDPKEVEKAVTPRTCAIIGVHIFGNPCDVQGLQAVARSRGLKLIFDAAHGLGAEHQGKKIGGFGDAESFSLSPTKLVTAGEGGIVATNDDGLAQKVRVGRNYGDSGTYDCEFSGFSARMGEFNGALGLESLQLLERNVKRRRSLVQLYKKLLKKIPGIGFQYIDKNSQSSYKDFSIHIDEKIFGLDRDTFCEALLAERVIVKKYFFPPVHRQKAFHRFAKDPQKLENTDYISLHSLSLPLYSHMPRETIMLICEAIKTIHLSAGSIRERNKR